MSMIAGVRSLGAAVVLASCLVPTSAIAAAGPLAPDIPPQRIHGGDNAPVCAWPTAVEVGGCTGTLVHPEVVIYAGHCGSNVSQAFFGESVYGGGGRSVPTQFCRTMPGWNPGGGTDFAVCKLAEPVTDVQLTPILMGCETEVLTAGREVVLVGFGQTESGSSGVKKEVTTTLDHIVNDEAWLGGGGEAPCYGDSGGPAFVKLPADEGYDDTWRVFGVTSHGDQVCGGGGYYGMMHNAIDWFEAETGVDITPCHDADGTWNPTADCQGFPRDPGASTGSWNEWCTPVPVGGASTTCGEPSPDIESDDEPPTVRIEAPVDGDDFEPAPNGGAALEVLVEAIDTGDGVAEVALEVDGALLPVDTTAPYAFSVTVDGGSHILQATATDLAGNLSTPTSVTVHVGPSSDDGSGDEGGDDGDDGDGGTEGGGETDDGAPLDDPYLPPGFGQAGGAAGCSCRSSDPAPIWPSVLLVLVGLRRRVRGPAPARARSVMYRRRDDGRPR